ncbi:chloride channel protein [Gloeocapsopsis sp. IPPAS B-1203]|uniref:chloride channel protein n=1 Tax=Gloeocapsopsis sp. IPPAS B-1203 TaxID=2049454 RepID=UPI000C186CAA|nr:chloride channel protein [Gloeocapsopsis sp. IPPAS B-1203]PIG92223.1 chloride channel protein [Gloeocapsopsis sp. IPPAS B-1203]
MSVQPFRKWLLPRRRLAIAEACLIGLVAAFSAIVLRVGVGWIGAWRVQTASLAPAWLILPGIGFFLGYIAGFLLDRLAPEASGSGIPQVKASLADAPVKLSLREALVKLIASTIALGSGLTLGRQGPTVHVGAALAAQFSRWVPTSPEHRRQMIAAGAGAGLAAAFNAPITGVLFVIEELLQDLSGLTLGTAIIASFIGAVVSRILGGRTLQLNLVLTASQTSFSLAELPFFLLLGLLAGVLGSLFNRGIIASTKFYNQSRLSLPLRMAIAGGTSGLVVAFLPATFRDNTGLREFLITGGADWSLAAIAFVAQFTLTLVAFGSGAPGGLFAPSLILGSSLGYLVGVAEQSLFGFGSPATYALAGMGAFFSVVSKVPITAIVIVFEMTTDFNLVLPLMIGSVTAYLIADKFFPGSLYDKLLELKGIRLPKEGPIQGLLIELKAKDVMQPRVETLAAQLSLDETIQAFSRSQHRGFPVVDEGKLVGIVTQADLAKARELELPGDTLLSEIMTPQPVTVHPLHSLSEVLYRLDRFNLSRLPVVENKRLIGIITRADIIRAEADKLNGETREIGPQPQPSYVVYQTRSPSIGRGRLLVPLANPQTAVSLLHLATAIARERHYELECLQIILVPRRSSPAETEVSTAKSRRLLREAEILARKWNIPIHTQIRVAHDVSQAILETVEERHIDLLLMGWKGKTITPGRVFGNVVDTLIRQATCDVILVRFGAGSKVKESSAAKDLAIQDTDTGTLLQDVEQASPNFNRWLVPMAGGPNANVAVKLLPGLISIGSAPYVRLCQIFSLSETQPDMKVLKTALQYLIRRRHFVATVVATPVKASSVVDGVLDLIEKDNIDVVMLGASREGLLQQTIKGNIPAMIASRAKCTVMLLRGSLNLQ